MKGSTRRAVLWKKRQMRVRKSVIGTSERPRLAVFRSHKHIYAQVVDDSRGAVIATASTLMPGLREDLAKKGGNRAAAERVGGKVAEAVRAKGITKVVFDRRGYRYHGRIQVLADAARKAGLEF